MTNLHLWPRLLPTHALASAACSTAIVAVGVRSYAYGTLVSYVPGPWSVSTDAVSGTVFVMWGSSGVGQHWMLSDYPHPDPGDMAGIDGRWGADRDGLWFRVWVPVGLKLVSPAAEAWRRRRRVRGRGFEVATSSASTPEKIPWVSPRHWSFRVPSVFPSPSQMAPVTPTGRPQDRPRTWLPVGHLRDRRD
jgi:hypothetical protein